MVNAKIAIVVMTPIGTGAGLAIGRATGGASRKPRTRTVFSIGQKRFSSPRAVRMAMRSAAAHAPRQGGEAARLTFLAVSG
jgi:hypothetical protein